MIKEMINNKLYSSPNQLSKKLQQVADLIGERLEELLRNPSSLKAHQFPTTWKQYRIDLEESRKVFEFYSKLSFDETIRGKEWRRESPSRVFYTRREPIGGIVGLITSFNYPLLLLSWKLAPALLAGNAVIVKPSHQSPHATVDLISRIHQKNIFTQETLQVVQGGSEVGQALVNDERVRKISFTGSTAVGRLIAKSCGEQLKQCTLELGGKNGAVVFQDADIEATVASIVDGAFSNMGQNCCGISRLLIHQSIYNKVVERIQEETAKLIIGDPRDPETDIGPVIDKDSFDRITALLDSGLHGHFNVWRHPGYTTQAHSASSITTSLIIPPTIFMGVPPCHPLAQIEIFGPVLCILPPFHTFEEAMSDLNSVSYSKGYGLASGCFTSSRHTAEAFAKETESGIVWINCWNECDPSVPFGGFGSSGMGKELGLEGYLAYTRQKSIVSALL